jgi:hypothetical protein
MFALLILAALEAASPLRDLYRFPSKAEVAGVLSFNRTFRERMTALAGHWLILRDEELDVIALAHQEAWEQYRAWDALDDALTVSLCISRRIAGMRRLRELLGDDAYHEGRMPPPVPMWRFRER